MLKIRLQRIGRRNNPAFRVVATESTRGPKSGNHVEILGSYNPHSNNATLNSERITYWIGNGAQVSDTVHNILVNEEIIKGAKKNVLPRKTPVVKEKNEEEEVASPTAESSKSGDVVTSEISDEVEVEQVPETLAEEETKEEETKQPVSEEKPVEPATS